jgi:hypothetical protein
VICLSLDQRAKRDAPTCSIAYRWPRHFRYQGLELMSREDINQLPVISDGRLQEIFSQDGFWAF